LKLLVFDIIDKLKPQDIDFLWDGLTGRYRFGTPCQNIGQIERQIWIAMNPSEGCFSDLG
jgi:hypothetical protein